MEDDRELVTEIRQLVILQVHIVQCDYSICSVEEAEKEIGKTSLTRARGTHHSKAITRGQFERNILEDWMSWDILEGYVLQGYLALCSG